MIDFASCLWNHRKELIVSKKHLKELNEAVNRPIDFAFHEWIKLYTLVLEFSPDLIIELGRGYGNSTCIFTEAINKIGKGKVVSIGYDNQSWEKFTVPSLQKLVNPQWFDKLDIMQQDIMKTDFTEMTQPAQRILLFWDAHGTELAQYVLSHLFPLLQKKEHLIIMHDVTDTGHPATPSENDTSEKFRLHTLESSFEEIIPAFNYISANNVQYDTIRSSVSKFLEENDKNSDKSKELKNAWDELVDDRPLIQSHMIYYNINNKTQS